MGNRFDKEINQRKTGFLGAVERYLGVILSKTTTYIIQLLIK
jgi:hypothetical protein